MIQSLLIGVFIVAIGWAYGMNEKKKDVKNLELIKSLPFEKQTKKVSSDDVDDVPFWFKELYNWYGVDSCQRPG